MFIIVVKNRRHTRKGEKKAGTKKQKKQTEVQFWGRGWVPEPRTPPSPPSLPAPDPALRGVKLSRQKATSTRTVHSLTSFFDRR